MNEVQRLRDRVDELESALGVNLTPPNKFGLTPIEAKIVGLLSRRDIVSKDIIYSALYGGMADCDQPDPKTVEVHISKMRRKLRGHGIEIKNRYNVGYYVDDATRASLRGIQ